MHCRAVAACILGLAAIACGTNTLSVRGERQVQETGIEPGEALTVVNASPATLDDVLQCVENALYKEAPNLAFVSSSVFRDSLFPWFEPATAPDSVEDLTEVLGNPAVRQRIQAFGLRYVIAVSGETDENTDSWGGCFGGYAGAGCVGGVLLNKKTDLAATILDVKYLRRISELAASGSGSSQAGMIVIVPYVTVNSTESSTCRVLAERIVQVLEGGPASSGETRELVIPPAGPG
jgi:hypothetical protein